jgi:hypothetical protein
VFTIYLLLCAASELVVSWRLVLKELDLGQA